MSDINVDWAAAPVDRDYTAAALEGAQAGQAQRAIGALRGINLDDPGSLNKGIANLVRAGAADQASALMGLQINRSLYNGLPGFLAQTSGQPAQAAPPQPQAAPDPAADLHAQVATDARAFAAASPDQQAAMKPALEAKYTKLGIPKDAIDGALQQVSTPEGAQAFAAGHDAHAAAYGGNPDPAAVQSSLPQGMAPPQQGDGVDPYTWAKNYLSHPQWGAYESMLKSRAGVDLGYTARAQAIMGPEFAQHAAVGNAAALAEQEGIGKNRTLAQTKGIEADMTPPVPGAKPTYDINGRHVGWQMADGSLQAISGSAAAQSGGAKQGASGYDVQEAPTGEPGKTVKYRLLPNPNGGPPIPTPLNGGKMPEGFGTSAGTSAEHNSAGQADALNAESTKAGERLVGYPHAVANLQTLQGLADKIGTGAFTPALSKFAQVFPLSHSAKEYAANTGLLASDLAATFKDALNGLPVPRIGTEAKSITDAVAKQGSPQDQVRVYAAGLLAATQFNQMHDKFVVDSAADPRKPHDLSMIQKEWNDGPGAATLFSMPAWQNVKLGGEPAVIPHNFGGQDRLIIFHGLLGKQAKTVKAP